MRLMNLIGGLTALAMFAVVASGEIGGQDPQDAGIRPMSELERIAEVVDALNARAVEPAQHGSFSGGEQAPAIEWDAVAAKTTLGAGDRSLIVCGVDVALLYVDSTGPADVQAKLLTDFRIASVTLINCGAVTPTANELKAFDALFIYTNNTFLDSVATGTAVANYVDGGGGVVLGMFAMDAPVAAGTLEGRFLSDDYYCLERTVAGSAFGATTLGTVIVPGHPVIQGVNTLTLGGAPTATSALHPKAVQVADWANGNIAIATRHDLSGRRVDLGFFPVSSDATINGWDASTDGARLMANALVWAADCREILLDGCAPSLLRQAPDISSFCFYSNTQTNFIDFISDQQVATRFGFPGLTRIDQVTLWGIYLGDANNTGETYSVPAELQRFVVNIHDDIGSPGAIVYTAVACADPEFTGFVQGNGYRVYRFRIDLPRPFYASAGSNYWLSPLGDLDDKGWCWQLSSGFPNAFGRFPAGSWSIFSGPVAYELCGMCDCQCPGDSDFDGDVDLDDLQLLLFYFGQVCR